MFDDIYQELTEIFRYVFEQGDLTVTPEMSAPDVEGWDSLANVQLFLSIENAFGIRFSTGELSGIENVGQLVESIAAKRSK